MSDPELRVALGHRHIEPGQVARSARRCGVDLLVLPRRNDLPAVPSDGDLAHSMGELAAEAGVALLFGYLEACSGRAHAALQLVLADGRAIANYRATHLSRRAGVMGLAPGHWLTMADLGGRKLGFMAECDHLAPEVGRSLTGQGAAWLLALVDPLSGLKEDLLLPLACLRAIESAVPVALMSPDGRIFAADARGRALPVRTEAPLSVVSLEAAIDAEPAPRRPDLYRRLVVVDGVE